MISCSAIQKLERYGELGLRRSGVDDFIHSSLKDARQANIYALTHRATWQECLAALEGTASAAAESETVAISDSLVYALSFTTALVGYAVKVELASAYATATAAAGATSSDVFAVAALPPLWKAGEAATAAATDDMAVEEEGGETADRVLALLTVLSRVTSLLSAPSHGTAARLRLGTSRTFTQAAAHLLGVASDLTVLVAALDLLYPPANNNTSSVNRSIRGRLSHAAKPFAVDALAQQSLQLASCATRLLHRAAAQHPVDQLLHARPCTAALRQWLQKGGGPGSSNNNSSSESPTPMASSLVTRRTMECVAAMPILAIALDGLTDALRSPPGSAKPSAGGKDAEAGGGGGGGKKESARLMELCALPGAGLFHKLSLLRAVVQASPVLAPHVKPQTARPARPTADDSDHDGEAAAATHTAASLLVDRLTALLSRVVSNRSTRYVIYYRGDDMKLLQSRIRQTADYALLTFVTTAPLEASLVSRLCDGAADGTVQGATRDVAVGAAAVPPPVAWRHSARLFAQWLVSAPFFFESFCADPSWAVFAQEQRRMALLRQSQGRREERRQKRAERSSSSGSGSGGGRRTSSSSSTSSSASSASSVRSASVGRVGSDSNSTNSANGSDEDDDARSTFSQRTAASRSMASLESRASVLSTLSKASAASYLSFITALKPEDEEEDARKLHESADGNTNLPLILLEETVLAICSFMEAYPASLLDRMGLRTLAWQSIAAMYAALHQSLRREGQGAAAAAAAPSSDANAAPPLFNLGQDLRYNHGLGYEALGLLFAKVVAPQLEAEGGAAEEDDNNAVEGETTATSTASQDAEGEEGEALSPVSRPPRTRGRTVVHGGDAEETRAAIDAAVSTCLAAYESVAPQVVDMNLRVILGIAARTSHATPTATITDAAAAAATTETGAATAAMASPLVLHDFLAAVVLRLGRNNQVPFLLQSLTNSLTRAAEEDEEGGGGGASQTNTRAEDVAALRRTFAAPAVRAALVQAAGLALDPECLLDHVIADVSQWAVGSASEDESSSDAADVAAEKRHLSLHLLTAVLEGIAPTSVTASSVLEKSAELELLLSNVCVEHVDLLSDSSSSSSCDVVVRGRRALLLHALQALHQCRAVTAACLRDLGLQQTEAFLQMLEETLWQIQSDVCALVGARPLAELARALGITWGTSSSSLSDEDAMVYLTSPAPLRADALLFRLSLQRLSLVRSVSVVLAITPGPTGAARAMVDEVLEALSQAVPQQHRGVDDVLSASARAARAATPLALANAMTEAEWGAVALFGRPKRLRAALVALLHHTFSHTQPAAAAAAADADAEEEGSSLPVWMARAMRCLAGTLFRALTDVVVAVPTEAVVARCFADESSASTATSSGGDGGGVASLPVMLRAVRLLYDGTGHNPYWPALLDCLVEWLAALHDAAPKHAKRNKRQQQSGATPRWVAVQQQLLDLMLRCLRYESRSQEVLRRVLRDEESVLVQAAEGQSPAAATAARRGRLLAAYVEAIGVPPMTHAEMTTAAETATGEANEEATRSFEPELTRVCRGLFQPQMIALLLSCANTTTTATTTTSSAASESATALLAFLHDVALSTALLSWREGGWVALRQLDATRSVRFLTAVPAAFAETASAPALAAADTAALGGFVRALKGGLCATFSERRRQKTTKGSGGGSGVGHDHQQPEEATEAAAVITTLEPQWVALLAAALHRVCAVSGGGEPVETEALCGSTSLLFRALLDGQRRRHRSTPSLTSEQVARAAHSSLLQAIWKAPVAGTGDQSTSSSPQLLPDAVAALICPVRAVETEGARAMSKDVSARVGAAVRRLTALMASSAGRVMLWLLVRMAEELPASTLTEETKKTPTVDLPRDSLAAYVVSRSGATKGDTDAVVSGYVQWLEKAPQAELTARPAVRFATASADDAAQEEGLAGQLAAIPAVFTLLGVGTVPRLLWSALEAVLAAAIPTPRALQASLDAAAVAGVAPPVTLLAAAAAAFQQLLRLCELPRALLVPSLLRLLPCALLAFRARTLGSAAAALLWRSLLRACAAPGLVDHDEVLLETLLLSLVGLLDADGAPAPAPTLTEEELLAVIRLLSQSLLPSGALWRRAALLPGLLTALFGCVLRAVVAGRVSRGALHPFSALLAQLAHSAEAAEEEESSADAEAAASGGKMADEGPDGGTRAGQKRSRPGAAAAGRRVRPRHANSHSRSAATASASLRLMTLAAVTAGLFQTAQHYVAAFTIFCSDLDYLAADLLQALRREPLPQARAPSITFKRNAPLPEAALSDMTLADLAFTSVGDAEGKALLKLSAYRLEEEEVEDAGETQQRHIFNVGH